MNLPPGLVITTSRATSFYNSVSYEIQKLCRQVKTSSLAKKRLEIMKRDGFQCKKCGDTENPLHVHHLEYIDGNDPWEYSNKFLVTLCEDCHEEIEDVKKDCPDLDYSKITIYKSDSWSGGNRIMFTTRKDILSMRIFNPNGKYIIGFNFRNDLESISRLIKKTQRYIPDKPIQEEPFQ